jgi:hypothetical protein
MFQGAGNATDAAEVAGDAFDAWRRGKVGVEYGLTIGLGGYGIVSDVSSGGE